MAKNPPLVNALDALLGGDDFVEDIQAEQAQAAGLHQEHRSSAPPVAGKVSKARPRVVEEQISDDIYEPARALLRVWMQLHLKGKVTPEEIEAACGRMAVEELYCSYDGDGKDVVRDGAPKADPNDPRGSADYRVTTFVQFESSTGKTLYRGVSMSFRPSVGGW